VSRLAGRGVRAKVFDRFGCPVPAGQIAIDLDSWMERVARNLLDVEDGFLLGKRHLILDRDPL